MTDKSGEEGGEKISEERTIYAAFNLNTMDGTPTGMHITLCYSDDTSSKKLKLIKNQLNILGKTIKGSKVRNNWIILIGHPIKNTMACDLSIIFDDKNENDKQVTIDDDKMKQISDFSLEHSYRKNLGKYQFTTFTLHASIGNPNSDNTRKRIEYESNHKIIKQAGRGGGIGVIFTIGDGYIKDMSTKEIIYEF